MAKADVDVKLRVTRPWIARWVYIWWRIRGRTHDEAIEKAADIGELQWNLGNGWEPVFPDGEEWTQ